MAKFIKSIPRIQLPPGAPPSERGKSIVGTPLEELVERKEMEDLHSSMAVEDGKPRRRSIGEGLG
jgi:hypothetical protein